MVMFYIDELKVKEIATRLDINENHCKATFVFCTKFS